MDPAFVAAYLQVADQNQQLANFHGQAWAPHDSASSLQEPAWLQPVPQRGLAAGAPSSLSNYGHGHDGSGTAADGLPAMVDLASMSPGALNPNLLPNLLALRGVQPVQQPMQQLQSMRPPGVQGSYLANPPTSVSHVTGGSHSQGQYNAPQNGTPKPPGQQRRRGRRGGVRQHHYKYVNGTFQPRNPRPGQQRPAAPQQMNQQTAMPAPQPERLPGSISGGTGVFLPNLPQPQLPEHYSSQLQQHNSAPVISMSHPNTLCYDDKGLTPQSSMQSTGSNNTMASTHVSPQATPLSTPKAEQAAAALRARLLLLAGGSEDALICNPADLLYSQEASRLLAGTMSSGFNVNGADTLTSMLSLCSLAPSVLDASDISRNSTATLAVYSSHPIMPTDGFSLWQ